jgi:putative ABC transport system substrate-binding protein
MIKRIVICLLPGVLLLLPVSPAKAQQPAKVLRIGHVGVSGDPSTPSPNLESFRQGLRTLGYIEGKNIQIESRYAEESWTASQALWPSLCNSKWTYLSSEL